MASEQFSLCWDNFHKNMSTGMNTLLENEDLVDVTLAVEGKYLKAHKMVLSVCSPYFKDLFKMNPCKHPIVFMKDVSYVAMSDLLQFMYQGEVQVSQENLTTFIKTAEALQIKGLTGDGNGAADLDPEALDEPKVPETKVPVQRQKKVQHLQQQHPVAPPPKRQRLIAPPEQPTPTITTKTEATIASTPSSDQIIQFKMEPFDHNQTATVSEDAADDTFGDDPLDDANADDTNEDYSMMEGGDEEPQAGTSGDGTAGEGQDDKSHIEVTLMDNFKGKRKMRTGVILDGFTYHHNTVKKNSNIQYLICAEYKRLACKARAQLHIGSNTDELIVNQDHNHPPFKEAGIRHHFISEIKAHISYQPTVPLREIYDCVSLIFQNSKKRVCKMVSSWIHRSM